MTIIPSPSISPLYHIAILVLLIVLRMCKAILALHTCSHFEVVRYITTCDAPGPSCILPQNWVQSVTYQCGGCDQRDQEILILQNDRNAALTNIHTWFEQKAKELRKVRRENLAQLEGLDLPEWSREDIEKTLREEYAVAKKALVETYEEKLNRLRTATCQEAERITEFWETALEQFKVVVCNDLALQVIESSMGAIE